MRRALVVLLLAAGCGTGAAADPAGPVPTAPSSTFPEVPPTVVAEVRAAVRRPGPFEVLVIDDRTAPATDDHAWAAPVRREGGTWRVAELASLG